jgi:hypothetical protein
MTGELRSVRSIQIIGEMQFKMLRCPHVGETMRVAIISTYPPRACGIATFSRDLLQALRDADPSVTVGVVSIVRDRRSPPAAEVLHVIRQDVRADYTTASAAIDAWGADAVLIEHEYGIFGGE